ncbi:MAG: GSCFA domain-containing protein, partial [Pseudomonadota bacterium]
GGFAPRLGAAGPLAMDEAWRPRAALSAKTRIATLGCGVVSALTSGLRLRRWTLLEAEPAPLFMRDAALRRFGWRESSARTGPVRTAAHLLQLLREVDGDARPALPAWALPASAPGGRWIDSQRPGVEPEGLETPEDVMRHRRGHLTRLRRTLARADAVVAVLSRAEAWTHAATGTVYPEPPGAPAGGHDPQVFAARLWTAAEIEADLAEIRDRLQRRREGQTLILAISPETPAWSTRSLDPGLAAGREQAALRCAMEALATAHDDVDYFPALELLTAPRARGMHFADEDLRPTLAAEATLSNAFCAPHEDERGRKRAERRRARRLAAEAA